MYGISNTILAVLVASGMLVVIWAALAAAKR
jgi:hypothetical protein